MTPYPIYHVDLFGALALLAEYLGTDAQTLRALAAADPFPHLGWDGGQGEAPIGSVWSEEGVILYALARWLRPWTAIEIGTSAGASTTHLAAALAANANGAAFTSVDDHSILSPGYECGQLLPTPLRGGVRLMCGDGVSYIRQQARVDFILEDMTHGADTVEAIWTHAVDILTPGGIIVSHDAAHPLFEAGIHAGIAAVLRGRHLPAPLVLLIRPGDTGLAIWRKPGERTA